MVPLFSWGVKGDFSFGRDMRNLCFTLALAPVLALLIGGCAGAGAAVQMPAQPGITVTRPAQLDTGTAQTSADGLYRIRYTADEEPVTINTLHTWTVHIETADGAAVDGAEVAVDGGMPEHNHGLPTKPLVTPAGDGNYRVEGLKFQMPGWWTVTVTVAAEGRQDSATFNLLLN